jgi:hypothetical protein
LPNRIAGSGGAARCAIRQRRKLHCNVLARVEQQESSMDAIVIEHVPVAELPKAWREKLGKAGDATVTVRIEEEDSAQHAQAAAQFADDPLFGMWRDRDDMADVAGYVRRLRASRFNADGSRNEP